ncbi:hypothetical protein OROMI_012164 [Orobanche minor]
MAETTSALCYPTTIPFPKEPIPAPSTSFASRRFSSQFQRPPSPSLRFTLKASGSAHFPGDDDFGFYPWENRNATESSVQWVSEERVTLFTSDGLIQIGGNIVQRRLTPAVVCFPYVWGVWYGLSGWEFDMTICDTGLIGFEISVDYSFLGNKYDILLGKHALRRKKQGKAKMTQRSQRFQESNYMDPNQNLCLGALFDIAATNGLDMGRRLCIIGFCRSIEMLCDVVEDTVLEHGGEVVAAEKATREGLHEKLTMTVAVPLLWGVPPASETLHIAVRSGGGIVDKVYRQWDFL